MCHKVLNNNTLLQKVMYNKPEAQTFCLKAASCGFHNQLFVIFWYLYPVLMLDVKYGQSFKT